MKTKSIVIVCLLFVLLVCCSCGIFQRETQDTGDIVETEEVNENTDFGTELPENTEMPVVSEAPQASEAKQIEALTEELLTSMTLEEKVAQLFVILPESLMSEVSCVTAAGSATKEAINEYPVGGFIYMEQNLQSESQVQEMLANVQTYSMDRIGLPAFLCVDEEGGTVARISGTGKFDVPTFENMASVGATGDTNRAYEIGTQMGEYLSELGLNVDFAPVADVWNNPDNQVVKKRSFGSDPQLVSQMCMEISKGLKEHGVYSTYKHFPGHGNTAADTHEGYAYTSKSLEEIRQCELIPFQQAFDNGVSFVMIAHISLPNVVGDNTPATLSSYIITDLLRGQMGFDGIVVTDAMNMGAIANQYSSSRAAVKALQAGADIILMPADFHSAYQGVLNAVEDGTLSQERIDESLRRIIKVKLEMSDEQGQ